MNPNETLQDVCRCGHTRREHSIGKSYLWKKKYYNVHIVEDGSGECGGTSTYAPGEPGPCGCTGFSTTPYR